MGMKILLLTAKNWKKSDFLGFRIFEVILPCTAEYQYSLGTPLQIHQTHHTGTATQNFTPIFFCDVVMNLKKLSMVFWFLALWLEAPSGPYEKWVWPPLFAQVFCRARQTTSIRLEPLKICKTRHTGTATQNFTPIFFGDVVINLKKLSTVFWFLALWLKTPFGAFETW